MLSITWSLSSSSYNLETCTAYQMLIAYLVVTLLIHYVCRTFEVEIMIPTWSSAVLNLDSAPSALCRRLDAGKPF